MKPDRMGRARTAGSPHGSTPDPLIPMARKRSPRFTTIEEEIEKAAERLEAAEDNDDPAMAAIWRRVVRWLSDRLEEERLP